MTDATLKQRSPLVSPTKQTNDEDLSTPSEPGPINVTRLRLSEWNRALPESGFGPFHTREGLVALERHSPYDLHLFGGFKDGEPVALFPVFRRTGPFGTAVVASPPPGMGVPSLGPLVFDSDSNRHGYERTNSVFTAAVLDALDVNARTLVFLLAPPGYDDPRPYRRHGLSVTSSFTYRIDAGGRDPDDLLSSFSRSRRREIRDAENCDVTVERGDLDDCRQIYEATRQRYAKQDETFWGNWQYVCDVVERLGDRARVYCARDSSGQHIGGVVVLYSNDAAYFWLGGSKVPRDDICVNSLLHWKILQDIATDPSISSVTDYDLVGAATERLSRYKSKFAPDLVPYYKVTSHPLKMRLAKVAYERVT